LSVSIIKGKMKPTINIPIIKKPRGMPQWFKQWSENVYNKNINEQQKFNLSLEQRVDRLENTLSRVIELNNLKS
jgi:hypothetical protein